jgi:hypothetical protein
MHPILGVSYALLVRSMDAVCLCRRNSSNTASDVLPYSVQYCSLSITADDQGGKAATHAVGVQSKKAVYQHGCKMHFLCCEGVVNPKFIHVKNNSYSNDQMLC